ncbi:hypothetical protein NE237_012231 [Protea cynaroides]|uniref:Uncharacterized protein n=1 Tax=Protea cynaroides TaxID=273540 RepID=A0A9Q0GZF0_9MAGN|nr:hypothetical protein NE237_012231 [Protea cynaroides]
MMFMFEKQKEVVKLTCYANYQMLGKMHIPVDAGGCDHTRGCRTHWSKENNARAKAVSLSNLLDANGASDSILHEVVRLGRESTSKHQQNLTTKDFQCKNWLSN